MVLKKSLLNQGYMALVSSTSLCVNAIDLTILSVSIVCYRWNKRSCGVACLVKDYTRRSYYIRVVDMERRTVVFDQEIYHQFQYKTPRSYFHTFEADDGQVGLNFADNNEAVNFNQVSTEWQKTSTRVSKTVVYYLC